jgi:hypothetical protein
MDSGEHTEVHCNGLMMLGSLALPASMSPAGQGFEKSVIAKTRIVNRWFDEVFLSSE